MILIFIFCSATIFILPLYWGWLKYNTEKLKSKQSNIEIDELKNEVCQLEAIIAKKKEEQEIEKNKLNKNLAEYKKQLKDLLDSKQHLKNRLSSLEKELNNKIEENQNLQNYYNNELAIERNQNNTLKEEILKLNEYITLKKKEDAELASKKIEEHRAKGVLLHKILTQVIEKKENDLLKEENEKRKLAEKEKELKLREIEAKKQEEEERQILHFSQLQQQLKAIGAKMTWKEDEQSYYSIKEYICDISVKEDINLDKLFSLLKSSYRVKYICEIYSKEQYRLLYVTITYLSIKIYFKENQEEKIFKKGNYEKQAKDFLFCYLENRRIKYLENQLPTIISDGIKNIPKIPQKSVSIAEKVCLTLKKSKYFFTFPKKIECIKKEDMLVVDYQLPDQSIFSIVKEYKITSSSKELGVKKYTESYLAQRYENALYSITLRSIYEIFAIDKLNEVNAITFNGFVTNTNTATGIVEKKCILSIQVNKEKFLQINLSNVDPKACFKALKGVSASKLIDVSPITPILFFDKDDKRFVDARHIGTSVGTNLAAMHWEDFEQLVRELFEMEFSRSGGEVHVTQASRDGGVDAIIFDPDPLRGGKIVVQAKRYTNTVGVSAVRDLYGTLINEGANTGILITTSDYGYDSYEFAKDKPLKLLNGAHLLAMLHKHGRAAHINIEEAKKLNE